MCLVMTGCEQSYVGRLHGELWFSTGNIIPAEITQQVSACESLGLYTATLFTICKTTVPLSIYDFWPFCLAVHSDGSQKSSTAHSFLH